MKTIFFIIVGGIIGSYITLRFEILKALKSYVVVRAEIDHNLQLINKIQDNITPSYDEGSQLKQIDEMNDSIAADTLPVRILELNRERVPSWANQAWNSQISLLAQILTDQQVDEIFEIQTDLFRLSSIHSQICELIDKYGAGSRDSSIKLFNEWEQIVKTRRRKANPLPLISYKRKVLLVTGLHHFIKD